MSPRKGFFESEEEYQKRIEKEAAEEKIKEVTGSSLKKACLRVMKIIKKEFKKKPMKKL
ncbi:MAG: hypothetical protein ACOC1O_05410 [bacterium]